VFSFITLMHTPPRGGVCKETIARLREIHPFFRAIVSSGYSNDPATANYSHYGFSGVVAKPYRIEDFQAVINRVLLSR
jgi:two-component system, cell cycle sensor histidine kinase and response regulator CckA